MTPRACDCGCGRPAAFTIEAWDLGFSVYCRDKFRAAMVVYRRVKRA